MQGNCVAQVGDVNHDVQLICCPFDIRCGADLDSKRLATALAVVIATRMMRQVAVVGTTLQPCGCDREGICVNNAVRVDPLEVGCVAFLLLHVCAGGGHCRGC